MQSSMHYMDTSTGQAYILWPWLGRQYVANQFPHRLSRHRHSQGFLTFTRAVVKSGAELARTTKYRYGSPYYRSP
jgi:hypothetical protein